MGRASNMHSRVSQSFVEGVEEVIIVRQMIECADSSQNLLMTLAVTFRPHSVSWYRT